MQAAEEFALSIVNKLQQGGYHAFWAGGCVRDRLLGLPPKDFDVATNARPDEVREIFGKQRTIAIGAAFGVITVIGTRHSGNVEVATFRRDGGYSDGRRPDVVEYSDPCQDAARRDFTINGMFWDPIQQQLIDFVGGKSDLECRIIRAIGDPEARIEEDKLRMLRGIRFSASFSFELESATRAAIEHHAPEIELVSRERIGMEIRIMLSHPNRARAVELLQQTGLLNHILPQADLLYRNRANWKVRLRWLGALGPDGTFIQAAAIMLAPLLKQMDIQSIAACWKLSKTESDGIRWIDRNLLRLSRGHQLPWSTIQPLLLNSHAADALQVGKVQFGPAHPGIQFCRERLMKWEPHRLNPDHWIDGYDLRTMGLAPGPIFSTILRRVRAAQLDGQIQNRQQALILANQIRLEIMG